MLLLALCEQRRCLDGPVTIACPKSNSLWSHAGGRVGWPNMANVLYERVGAASLLTIDRPEHRNAIDGQTAEELLAGYRSFESDENARVLVVTGSGEKAFSAGADLKALESLGSRVDSVEGVLGFTRLVSPKPTIAAISGWCVAAGLVLALWCDLRIATEDARFGFPDRKWGVPILDGGTKRLVATVGVSRALELVMTGREIDAPEAHRLGLANEVVANGRHVEHSLELAELLAGFPQETLRADRQAIRESLDRALLDSFARDAEVDRAAADVATQGASEFSSRGRSTSSS
jgi:enoyl-CoA hydratase